MILEIHVQVIINNQIQYKLGSCLKSYIELAAVWNNFYSDTKMTNALTRVNG